MAYYKWGIQNDGRICVYFPKMHRNVATLTGATAGGATMAVGNRSWEVSGEMSQRPRGSTSIPDADRDFNSATCVPPPPLTGDHPASPFVIFAIDDDHGVREAMRAVLESNDRTVETYSSAEAFLEGWHPDRYGCLVVDACMRGISGVELVERLAADGYTMPSIIITGFADVRMAVRAMKAGAADFIEKPVRADVLLASIDAAVARTRHHVQLEQLRKSAAARVSGLTNRQRQIMHLVVSGFPSKNIAANLGISQRTVENHRAAIMKRTGTKSIPGLARLALGLG